MSQHKKQRMWNKPKHKARQDFYNETGMTTTEFSEYLINLMRELNINNTELADKLGVSVGCISRWRNKSRVPWEIDSKELVEQLESLRKNNIS